MKSLHDKRFPNETKEYREARDKLLEAEIQLRRQTEEVAKVRRALPLGGKLTDDYVFTDLDGKKVKFSELFKKGDTVVVYSMMFDPAWDAPCHMCNSIVDGLNGNARQITQKTNLVVIGKAPYQKLKMYAKKTGWNHIRILSSFDNTFNKDYFAEQDGEQWGIAHVFTKKKDCIYHTWTSELIFVPTEPGQDFRVVDIIWPLYNVLDLTPEGREDFYPMLDH